MGELLITFSMKIFVNFILTKALEIFELIRMSSLNKYIVNILEKIKFNFK